MSDSKKTIKTLTLNVSERNVSLDVPAVTKKIFFEVSRSDCRDVLLEVVDQQGRAKGKPLDKQLPEIKGVGVSVLRFMMNDFSTRPITITVSFK
ncbi:hypothetical protein DMA11_04810 [Marinilabiliaceae bacterium JC017]|nr:hypothetical protein DMA11_04810 [Marinilabiliaceae bacterium JC017]